MIKFKVCYLFSFIRFDRKFSNFQTKAVEGRFHPVSQTFETRNFPCARSARVGRNLCQARVEKKIKKIAMKRSILGSQ